MPTHFTLIIPTRERADTLRHTLATCLTEDYANLRIVVSNNASTDDTEQVVRALNDPRVELISTPRRMSMSENFEFSIRHVLETSKQETYVSIIGDDDGLMPGALRVWDSHIRLHPGVKAFSWTLSSYTWPTCNRQSIPNVLNFSFNADTMEVKSSDALAQLASFDIPYTDVCRVYYGLVHHTVLEQVKKNGRYIHSMMPDVYLGIAVTCLVEHFVVLPYPFSIVGVSKHSTGSKQILGGESRDKNTTDALFWSEGNLPPHRNVACTPPSLRLCEMEVIQHLIDLGLFGHQVNVKGFFCSAIKEALTHPADKYGEIMTALGLVAGINGWQREYDEALMELKPAPLSIRAKVADQLAQVLSFDIATCRGVVDCSAFDVHDIFGGAKLAGHFLGQGDVHHSLFGLVPKKTLIDSQSALPEIQTALSTQKARNLKLQRQLEKLKAVCAKTTDDVNQSITEFLGSRLVQLSCRISRSFRRKRDQMINKVRKSLGHLK